MKKLMIVLALSMSVHGQTCVDYGGGVVICTDDDGKKKVTVTY